MMLHALIARVFRRFSRYVCAKSSHTKYYKFECIVLLGQVWKKKKNLFDEKFIDFGDFKFQFIIRFYIFRVRIKIARYPFENGIDIKFVNRMLRFKKVFGCVIGIG